LVGYIIIIGAIITKHVSWGQGEAILAIGLACRARRALSVVVSEEADIAGEA
jgi:hypothetical protein